MMEPNVPLLRKVVEWVEWQDALEPEEGREWNQGTWFSRSMDGWCGTAMCVAGKVALDAGWVPVFHGADDLAATQVTKDGRVDFVETVAAQLLGFDSAERLLFSGSNDAADIRRIAEEIAGERL